jgi:peptide deformylase
MEIETVPANVLKQKSLPVDIKGGEDCSELAKNMMEKMYECDGCGLAAPQVGVLKRLIVVDFTEDSEEDKGKKKEKKREPIYLVNPEIVSSSGDEVEGEEGCLSIPGIAINVKRPESVKVRAFGLEGNEFELDASGFPARVLQHEIDHLEGRTLFEHLDVIDRIEKFREYELAVASGAKPGQTSTE